MIKLVAKLLLVGLLVCLVQIDRAAPEIRTLLAIARGGEPKTAEPMPTPSPTDVERAAGARQVERVIYPAGPAPYDALIRHHAGRTGLRPALVTAVVEIESGFDPNALSEAGARGLMQLMPDTAQRLGVQDSYDPNENLRGGTVYLSRLLSRFRGDEGLALAAYNAGPGTVERYGNRVPPYPETQQYVTNVRAATKRRTARPAAGVAGEVQTSYLIDDGWWTVVHTTYATDEPTPSVP